MTGLVVDTSAVIAILTSEPDGPLLALELEAQTPRLMASATLVEVGIVFEARYGAAGGAVIERFLRDAGIDVVAFDQEHAARAMDGWRRFGKGRHPAALNLGDCFTYGLATAIGHPVLCVGADFTATDVDVVQLPRSP